MAATQQDMVDDASAGDDVAGVGASNGGPRLGVVGWVRWTWRQLTSMRTALFLLLLVALAAIPGSVLPQRGMDPTGTAEYIREHERVGPVLDALGFFNVYSSVWFSAIYLLLFISLVGCILPRIRVYAQRVQAPPQAPPVRLDRQTGYGQVTVVGNPAEAMTMVARALRSSKFRVRVASPTTGKVGCASGGVENSAEANGSGAVPTLWVAGETGYLREAGNLVFHIALVGLLVSFACSSLLGYSGQMVVPVGESVTHSRFSYDAYRPGKWVREAWLPPFDLTLDDMEVTFEDNTMIQQFGEPRSFKAQVSAMDTGGRMHEQLVQVNEPLYLDGVMVSLAGDGYAPKVTVRDGDGNVAFSGLVPMLPQDPMYTSTGVVKVPDAKPQQLGLQTVFLPTAVEGSDGLRSVFPGLELPELVFSVMAGDLGLDAGAPQSVFTLDTDQMQPVLVTNDEGLELPYRARLRPGQTIELPDGLGSVTFESVDRYAALSVRHDPGARWALVSALVALAGLGVSLYIRRRRVWFRVVSSDGGASVVEYAGWADGTDVQTVKRLTELARKVEA